MPTYEVTIAFTGEFHLEVEADNKKEAEAKAVEIYGNANLSLDRRSHIYDDRVIVEELDV